VNGDRAAGVTAMTTAEAATPARDLTDPDIKME